MSGYALLVAALERSGVRSTVSPVDALLEDVEAELGYTFPSAYSDLLPDFHGGAGSLSDEHNVAFYPVSDLVADNAEYAHLGVPAVIFAGNGGGDVYAFLRATHQVVQFPLVTDARNFVDVVGVDFVEFLTSPRPIRS